MARIRILVADNNDVLRRGLRSLLSSRSGWSICGETRNGYDAVRLALELKPDVVILDFDVPELGAIEATRRIKRALPATEILCYTTQNEEYLIAEALTAGARGHVLKSDSEKTLLEAVGKLAQHLPFISTQAGDMLLKRLLRTSNLDEIRLLTTREREIVQLLSDSKSNKEIATQLRISVKTVEAHRSAVMRKLGLKSITELVRYAIRNKIIQP